jgi:poly(beta-D-mannuronate) lyase
MNTRAINKFFITSIGVTCVLTACTANVINNEQSSILVPADNFDLSYWKVTLPVDEDDNGKVDEIDVKELQTFSHPNYFYLDENGDMVFTAPNKGATTSSLASTRSELRQMNRGINTKIGTHAPANNVAIAANKKAEKFSSIGGKLNATLKINAVSLRAGHPEKRPAYTVVIAQVHTGKIKGNLDGFGWGNQPIKIYYKKFPEHDKGSIFWNYERNLPRNDPNRIDISYPVWGNTWLNRTDPGVEGISLGEELSYEINIHENMMHLTFQSEGHPDVKYSVDISNNVNPYGKVDKLDNPGGYTGDWFYFKAGAYNECNSKDAPHFVYTACPGTGNWATDKLNGDFASVTFSKLVISKSTPVK